MTVNLAEGTVTIDVWRQNKNKNSKKKKRKRSSETVNTEVDLIDMWINEIENVWKHLSNLLQN